MNKGIMFIYRAYSKFYKRKVTKNCRKMNRNHRNTIGITAALSFLMTTNFISAPTTKRAMMSLTNHASGSTKASTATTISEHTLDRLQISQTFSRIIDRRSAR